MKKDVCIKLALSLVGILLVGTGVAFNASAALGNDPVGIVYDGIRNVADLSPGQLGVASNIVNIVLVIVVFCLNRHYVNIGTFIYIIPYGSAVSLGGKLYAVLFPAQTLAAQITGAVIGCALLYTGVAMFIATDMGLDPFTGLVMVIRDKAGKEYKTVKICFDIGCILCGFILGGRLGVITIVTALTAGPVIQFLSGKIAVHLKAGAEV